MKGKFKSNKVTLALKATVCLGLMAALIPQAQANENSTEYTSSVRNLSFTLITGDKVSARLNTDGTIGGIRLVDKDGGDVFTSMFKRGGETYVIPAAAQDRIDSGSLDLELFNIDKLYQAGYDDARSDSLQVIVEYRENTQSGKPFSMDMPGAKLKATFDIIDSVVMSVEKAELSNVLENLSANTAVEGVWLDAMVQAHKESKDKAKGKNKKDKNGKDKWWHKFFDIDETSPTVPLTGAYGSHAMSFNGEGVKVAVLDTGYDTDHPDLASNVILSYDFNRSGSNSVDDLNGHGTHTASTVAGSGVESNGKYVGMAPGAQLLIGKVLNDAGGGLTSGILSGMQWAVDNGADIVSMSLGGSATSCSGPLVDMLEELSDDALFVVSAGNSFTRETVGSPGCAPSALTVGAIDRIGQTAEFSSRGPSPDGHSAKPDITSQGVAVIASASGGKGETAYRAYSGTSMSAPHVSGGAALVLQARPDLTPRQLKAVLTSSVSTTDAHVLDQGAGPMDVNRAIVQSVIAPPNMELGFFDYQQENSLTQTSVSLSNLSDEDVTLDLELSFLGDNGLVIATEKLAGLSVEQITIPANGNASVPLWIDPTVALDNATYGTITGRLIGSEVSNSRGKNSRKSGDWVSADNEKVTVPVSFWIEPPTMNLTLTAIDRLGLPAASPSKFYIVSDEDDWGSSSSFVAGTKTIELPKGRYSVVAHIMTYDNPTSYGGLVESATMMAELSVDLASDQEIVFDANTAEKITFKTDKPSEMQGFSFGFTYALSDQEVLKLAATELAPDYVTDFYGLSKGNDPRFNSFVTTRAFAPKPIITTAGGTTIDYILAGGARTFNGEGSTEVVAVGDGGYSTDWSQFDVAGKIALVDADYYITSVQVTKAIDAGAIGIIGSVVNRTGRYKATISGNPAIPVVTITQEEMAKLYEEIDANGSLQVSWSGTAHEYSPYVYSLVHSEDGYIKTGTLRVKDKDLAAIEAKHYTQGAERPKFTDVYAALPSTGEFYATGSPQMLIAPLVRTEYFTGSESNKQNDGKPVNDKQRAKFEEPTITWTNLVMPTVRFNTDGGLFDGPRELTKGAREVTSWDKAPWGSTLITNGTPRGYRDTNLLSINNASYGDAAGHDGGLGYSLSSAVGISVDGQQAYLTNGYLELPDESVEIGYSINTYKRGVGNVHVAKELLGSELYVMHTFTTSAEKQGLQDILIPVIDIPLDLENTAKANSPVRIKISGKNQGDGDVELTNVSVTYRVGRECQMYRFTSCRVDEEVSFPYNRTKVLPEDIDENATVEKINGQWYATIPNEGVAGDFIHMRIIVTDENNSTTDQSLLRAYMLD